MTLATRCSACGTSFRVVQDQLKVSGGWVRCGRCNEVFNALEGLYEIYTQPGELPHSTPARAPASPPAASSAPKTPEASWRPPARPGVGVPSSTPDAEPRPDVSPAAASPFSVGAYGGALDEVVRPWGADSGAAAPVRSPEELEAYGDDRAPHAFDDVETRLEPRPGEDIDPPPSFLKPDSAPASHSRRSPAQQALWIGVSLLLVCTLVLQLALAWRDTLASLAPQLRPALSTLCEWSGCQVEPLRRMASLSVEGSNLRQKTGEGNYELLVNLRNRSELSLMLPAFELTLTDTQGQALIRRVLQPREMGARSDTIAAAGELSLLAALQISDRRIAGYTVEIFYP